MSKQITTLPFFVICILGLIFMSARSCGLSDNLKQQKKNYEEYRRIVETENVAASIRVDELTKAIGHRDETIVRLEAEKKVSEAKTKAVQAELAELQNAEPSQPELESQPLVISLRKQVSKLTEMYSLSQQTVSLQSEQIDAFEGKCIALESIGVQWKGAYEREHTLRLAAEDLFKSAERRLRLGKPWRVAAVVATGIATGLLLLK